LARYVKLKYKVSSTILPNGVSKLSSVKANKIKKWGLEKNDYILTVTRLVGHKGIQYLIAAFNGLKTKKKLVIVGDGAYTDNYVKELKAAAEGNKNIIFTGNQSGRELAELFSNAYLFVQPSESEGLSIALLEAMAYKKCVLVSDIPENLYVSKGVGLSFINKSVNSLRIKLRYLLNHHKLVVNYGLSAQARVKEYYNWDKIVKDTIEVYQTASRLKISNGLFLKQAKKLINFIF
jgi:glycosyltransferase involved in cell wall biosynthesis